MGKYEIKDGVGIIPEGVTEIGFQAFYDCKDLISITIPKSVTEIGALAFNGCTGLTSIVVAEGNSVYDSRENCNAIIETATNMLFIGCSSTIIPEGVTSIGKRAFDECTGLTNIVIPEGVTRIGTAAFEECTGLTSIVIPEGVTSIGEKAFYGCTGLTSVVIPESVTEIGDFAFCGCSGLTSIVIPEGVTRIGSDAFLGCTGLTSITIPKSVINIHHRNPFQGCTGLTSIVVEEGNEKYESCNANAIILKACEDSYGSPVGASLMVGCANTVIPQEVEEISYEAFAGSRVTEIEIPDNVKSILHGAFMDCKELTRVVIPDTVKKIEYYTFRGCVNLTHVEIPWSVEEVESGVFEDCTSLTDLVYTESVNQISEAMYRGCTGLTRIEIPAGTTEIGDCAFYGCTNLKEVILPVGVKKIGEKAFKDCTSLESIKVPAKKGDYYRKRLPETLHHLIAEPQDEFAVTIAAEGCYMTEVTPICGTADVAGLTWSDVESLPGKIVTKCVISEEWDGKFSLKVTGPKKKVVYKSDKFSDFVMAYDTDAILKNAALKSKDIQQKAAQECEKRWAVDAAEYAPGIYAVACHKMKSWKREFVIMDTEFTPGKLFFAIDYGMTGMMFDFPTDADHIVYGGKFIVLDDMQDPLCETETTYSIMQKDEDGIWSVLRKF